MAKLLRVRDYLLLGLAAAGEFWVFMRDPAGLQAFSHQMASGWVPKKYRRGTCLTTVYRLLKTGEIEKIVKNDQPYFRLTNKGKKSLIRDFPILKLSRKKWDRLWTVVIFDIPEKQRRVRRELVAKLLELGFGMIQRSTYLSPHNLVHDLRELLAEGSLADQVFVARTQGFFIGDHRRLAERIWDLERVNRRYRKIISLWENRGELTETEMEKLKNRLRAKYLQVLIADPFLPKELLPDGWVGEGARKLIGSWG